MVLLAGECHFDLAGTDDIGDNADLVALGVQNRALFDMHLDIAGERKILAQGMPLEAVVGEEGLDDRRQERDQVVGLLPLLGLAGFVQPFDMISMLGFLILMGTVVNNPILIVERAAREIEEQGMGIREAVREATRTRLRPVMMSTITTVFGLSPLVLLPGAGAELYRGLGAIVLFGLLFSSFITLTVLPVLLTAFFKLAQRFSRAA